MTHSQLLGTGRLSTLNGFVIHTVSQSIYLSRNATDTGPDTNAGCNLRWQVPSANRWTFADRCPPLTRALRWQVPMDRTPRQDATSADRCPPLLTRALRWQVSSADRCPWTGHQGRMQPPLTGALRWQVPMDRTPRQDATSADRCPPLLPGALRWQVPMDRTPRQDATSADRWTFADRCPPLTGAHEKVLVKATNDNTQEKKKVS